ncbi:hypothetical protein HPB52_003169 [Rhipicephalus sanguineus]|uniref:Uncharacterized protein n=1 Tax=Rhipicephalus sanguineus TaxID=34632 RepID=A0A9D4QDB7_RHISA|nr:hypothetical protein HPB52_003169 [Rhipicephalus sanguineus]
MEYTVEGQGVSPEELSGESWQLPGHRVQEQRQTALRLATAAAKPTTTPDSLPSSSPPSKRVNVTPLQHRRHAPLPRLPADTIHIVGRPKSPVELTKLQPWHLSSCCKQRACKTSRPHLAARCGSALSTTLERSASRTRLVLKPISASPPSRFPATLSPSTSTPHRQTMSWWWV